MADFDLRKLQLVEYEMLVDVAEFCDKNNIQYFLSDGTLLGAIRHGGFIPWDDDIDICMDLKNYKKFIKLAPKGLSSKYFVQNFKTEKKFNSAWTKIRINNTTSMIKSYSNYSIHCGICMDVFLINGVSNNSLRRNLQSKAVKLQNILLNKYLCLECKSENEYKNNKFYYKILPECMRRVLITILDKLIQIDLSKCEYGYNTFYKRLDNCEKLKSVWFNSSQRAVFEDREFSIPKMYEEILTAVYGDWRTPPPEKERGGHGDLIVDFERDCTFYRK